MSLTLSNCTNQKYLYEQANKLNEIKKVDEMNSLEKLEAYKKYKDYLTDQNYFVQSVGALFWDITRESSGDLSLLDELLNLIKTPCISSGIEFEKPILIGLEDLHKSYIPRLTKNELNQFIIENRFRGMQTVMTSQKAYVLKLILLHNMPVVDENIIELLNAKLYASEFSEKRDWFGLKDFIDKQYFIRNRDTILLKEERQKEILLNLAKNLINDDKILSWKNTIDLSRGHIIFKYLPLALEILNDIKNNKISGDYLLDLDVNLPMQIKKQLLDIIYYFSNKEFKESQQKRALKFKKDLCKASIERL